MVHLGRWYRHGTGVAIDLDIAEKWYQKAADLKDGKGHNGLGRLCFKSNPNKAAAHFYMAVEMGELTGYSHLADLDRKNELAHLKNALQTGEAYEDYSYGQYLIRNAQTDEEKDSHLHWIEKAAKRVMGLQPFTWPCTTTKKTPKTTPTTKPPKSGAAWVATPASW